MLIYNLLCEYRDSHNYIKTFTKDYYNLEKVKDKYNELISTKNIETIKVVERDNNFLLHEIDMTAIK